MTSVSSKVIVAQKEVASCTLSVHYSLHYSLSQQCCVVIEKRSGCLTSPAPLGSSLDIHCVALDLTYAVCLPCMWAHAGTERSKNILKLVCKIGAFLHDASTKLQRCTR